MYLKVDIVVGTPGRMEDLISTGQIDLSQCRFFVLDEADGLLKAGYSQFITRIHQLIPKVTGDGKRLQMIVCSATLHDFEVKKLAVRNRCSNTQLTVCIYLLLRCGFIYIYLIFCRKNLCIFPRGLT